MRPGPEWGTTPHPARLALAIAFSLVLVLLVAGLLLGAVMAGAAENAMRFFLHGLITLGFAALTYRCWAWERAGRIRTYVDTDAPAGRHTGLTEETQPPSRW